MTKKQTHTHFNVHNKKEGARLKPFETSKIKELKRKGTIHIK